MCNTFFNQQNNNAFVTEKKCKVLSLSPIRPGPVERMRAVVNGEIEQDELYRIHIEFMVY